MTREKKEKLPRCSIKKAILKNFTIFKRKTLRTRFRKTSANDWFWRERRKKKRENLKVYARTLYAAEMKRAYDAHGMHINIFRDLFIPFERNKKTNPIRREYKTEAFFINRSRIRGILVNFGKLLRTAFCRHLSVASFFSKFPVIILVIQRFIQKYPFADVLQLRYSIFTGKNLYWNVLLKRDRCFP